MAHYYIIHYDYWSLVKLPVPFNDAVQPDIVDGTGHQKTLKTQNSDAVGGTFHSHL